MKKYFIFTAILIFSLSLFHCRRGGEGEAYTLDTFHSLNEEGAKGEGETQGDNPPGVVVDEADPEPDPVSENDPSISGTILDALRENGISGVGSNLGISGANIRLPEFNDLPRIETFEVAVEDHRHVLTWGLYADAAGYKIKWHKTYPRSGEIGEWQTVNNVSSPYTHRHLENGSEYCYRVFGLSQSGENVAVTAQKCGVSMVVAPTKVSTILPNQGGGIESAIAIDENYKLHVVSIHPSSGDLKYFTNSTNEWKYSTLVSRGEVPRYFDTTDIAVCGDFVRVVYYFDNNVFRYAQKSIGGPNDHWIDESIDIVNPVNISAGRFVSMAVDSQCNVHVAYLYDPDMQAQGGYTLGYAVRSESTGEWQTRYFDSHSDSDMGWQPDIAVDSQGKVHISHHDRTYGSLRYTTNATEIGEFETITIDDREDGVKIGEYSSIAVDRRDTVHISYYQAPSDIDDGLAELKYATRTSGEWIEPLHLDRGINLGQYDSLVIDGSGHYFVSYYDANNKNLNFYDGRTIRVIDETGDVGRFSSMAMNSRGDLVIVYYDESNHKLKLAAAPLNLDTPIIRFNFGN